MFTRGLGPAARSPRGSLEIPNSPAARMLAPVAHMAVLRRELSTTRASPVRSRWNRAAQIPPAIVMPPSRSPNAGPGGGAGQSPSGLMMSATARYQNEAPSKPPFSASGPRWPCPEPRT